MTTSVGMFANRRNWVPHLGLHHFNPPSLDSKLTRNDNLGKNTKVLQGTKGCKLKYKFWQQWTMFLCSQFSYASMYPKGSLYSSSMAQWRVESEWSQGIWKARSKVSRIHAKENQKDLDYAHIPMYMVLGVTPLYINFHMFLGMF